MSLYEDAARRALDTYSGDFENEYDCAANLIADLMHLFGPDALPGLVEKAKSAYASDLAEGDD